VIGRARPWLAAGAAALALLAGTARAQGIGLPNQSRNVPVEIDADDGIEWRQDSQAYIARGNARARQGDVAVHADRLTAFYRKSKAGKTEIYRFDADGKVRIVSPRQTAYGEKGIYDVVKGIMVLTGSPRLVTAKESISAGQSLEFWEKKSLAVARGNAVAVREDKRLKADVLTAHFARGKDGKTALRTIEAFDNVLISSAREIVRARRGVYDARTGIVRLAGSVKITRGNDQLNGEAAEVNLNTGVSRIVGGGARVKGSFKPQGKPSDKAADKPAAR